MATPTYAQLAEQARSTPNYPTYSWFAIYYVSVICVYEYHVFGVPLAIWYMLGQTFNWPRVRAFCLAHVLSKPSTVPFKGALKLLALAPFLYGALVAIFSFDVLDHIDVVEDVMDRWDVRLPAAVYIVAFVCSILLPWFSGHPTYKAPPITRTIQLGREQPPRVPEYNSQAKQLVLWSVLEGVFCGVTLWIHLATCLSLFYDCASQSPWPSAAALTTVGIYLTQVTLNKSFTRQDFTRRERDLLSVLGVAINPLANENGVDLVKVCTDYRPMHSIAMGGRGEMNE